MGRVDRARVQAAIEAVERDTSGTVIVSVARLFWGRVEPVAWRTFDRMRTTRDHNGVLIFVVPARRKLVVLGGTAIHDKVGQAFWDASVAAIGDRLRTGDVTTGLVHGVELIGAQLAAYFPRTAPR